MDVSITIRDWLDGRRFLPFKFTFLLKEKLQVIKTYVFQLMMQLFKQNLL